MSRWTGALVIGGAAAAAAVAVRRQLQRRGSAALRRPSSGRWVITVCCPPDRLAEEESWPEPLRRLRDDRDLGVRIEVGPAPGDKGTEIAAVPTGEPATGRDRSSDDRTIRLALRQTQQLLEAGEVLLIDPRPHGTRTPTPAGWLMDAVADRADAGGIR